MARQTHSPYNRGVALGEGKVFVGTVDGRLIALDMKTGKVAWDTKLQDSQKLTVGFTGAPLYANGTVVIGSQGGEWPGRGPIYGVDAETGKVKWTFLTVAPARGRQEDLGQRFLAHRRRRRLDAGHLRRRVQHGVLGHRQPGAALRLVRHGLEDPGRASGRQSLHHVRASGSISTPASLKFYHQELPHDAWDFDSAVGRVRDARPGRSEVYRASQQERFHLRL